MRTTTLALLSGAAMSISAASIYNATPAGGFRGREAHASLEPLAPREWPRLEPASGEATASAFAPLPSALIAATSFPAGADPIGTAQPVVTGAVLAAPPASTVQVAEAKAPQKLAPGWRGARSPKPPPDSFASLRADPPRVVVRREPPPQLAMPTATAPSFRSPPPGSSVAAPMSTSSAMSTAR